eukprot:GHVS01099493.1.p1 GENE.GHVS01099493.1~~GHVS01099493.1.p1  ORF type:complete len:187 (+),score=46.99 GHVS01099493.1:309-869(+)
MSLSLPFMFVLGLVAIVLTAIQTHGLLGLEKLKEDYENLAGDKEEKEKETQELTERMEVLVVNKEETKLKLENEIKTIDTHMEDVIRKIFSEAGEGKTEAVKGAMEAWKKAVEIEARDKALLKAETLKLESAKLRMKDEHSRQSEEKKLRLEEKRLKLEDEMEVAKQETDKCFKALNDAVEGHGRR